MDGGVRMFRSEVQDVYGKVKWDAGWREGYLTARQGSLG